MDQGNSRQAIGARVLGMFTGADVRWWACVSADGWVVTSRMVDDVPVESRSGSRFTMIVGPFGSRRQAEDARAKFSSPQAEAIAARARAAVEATRREAEFLAAAALALPGYDVGAAMSRDCAADGTVDGPGRCGCAVPQPVTFYGRMVCKDCDGDLPEDDDGCTCYAEPEDGACEQCRKDGDA